MLEFTSTSQYIKLPNLPVAAPNALVKASLSVNFWIQPVSPQSGTKYIFQYSTSGVTLVFDWKKLYCIVRHRSLCIETCFRYSASSVCNEHMSVSFYCFCTICHNLDHDNSQLGFQTHDQLKLGLLLFSLCKWRLDQTTVDFRCQYPCNYICPRIRCFSLWRLPWKISWN